MSDNPDRVAEESTAVATSRPTRVGGIWLYGEVEEEHWEPPPPAYWQWECGRCMTSGSSFHSLTRAEDLLADHLQSRHDA